jgi:perosamine synthetase
MREVAFFVPDIDSSELKEIEEVLNSEDSKIIKLEEAFEKFIPSSYAIATSSGTSALHLAMCALDLKRGDKVICSVNAFPSIPEVVRHFDAEPIFIDIDGDDFNINLDELESFLSKNSSKKLKAIIVNHVAGQTTNLDRLYEIAKQFDIKVIEDGSQALGLTFNKKNIGALKADVTTFSFSPHLTNSIANGGMFITNNEELATRAKLLRNHAIVTNGYDKYGNIDYVYDVIDIGCKYDMSELSAAFSLAQFKKLQSNITKREEIAKIYNKELKDVPHISIPIKKREHIYYLYIIKIDKNRDDFARKLKERGIAVGLHYIPLHLLSYYKTKYSLKVNDFPTALKNYQQILSIPIYAKMSNEDIEYVIKHIREIAKNRV